jgi:hypothetical protein
LIPPRESVEYFEEIKWPVSGEDYARIYKEILSFYFATISELHEKDRDLVFADSSFVLGIIKTVHFRLAVLQSERMNLPIVSSNATDSILSPNWDSVGSEHEASILKVCSGRSRFKTELRRFIGATPLSRRIIGYRPPGTIIGLRSGRYFGMGRDFEANDLYRGYLALNGRGYEIIDWEEIVQRGMARSARTRNASSSLSRASRKKLQAFIGELSNFAISIGIKLEQQSIFSAWLQRLATLSRVYACVNSLGLGSAKACVVAENNAYRKTLCLALQQAGADLTAFLHGDTLSGVYNQRYGVAISRSFVKNYITPGKNNARLQSDFYGGGRSVYTHVDVEYKVFRRRGDSDSRLQGIGERTQRTRILLFGYPMNTNRYLDDESLFFHPKLGLEIRILTSLKRAGYDISYRPHPDRFDSCIEIFKELEVPLSAEPFGEVSRSYEIFIFTHPTTSTFGYLLQSSNSLILFDGNPDLWRPTYKELLRKRCEIIEVKSDLEHQQIFEEDDFLSTVEKVSRSSTKCMNTEFVDSYFH